MRILALGEPTPAAGRQLEILYQSFLLLGELPLPGSRGTPPRVRAYINVAAPTRHRRLFIIEFSTFL